MKIKHLLLICICNILHPATIELELSKMVKEQTWNFKEKVHETYLIRVLNAAPNNKKESFFYEISCLEIQDNKKEVSVSFTSGDDDIFFEELSKKFQITHENLSIISHVLNRKCDHIIFTTNSHRKFIDFLSLLCTKDNWLQENENNVLNKFLEFYDKIRPIQEQEIQ